MTPNGVRVNLDHVSVAAPCHAKWSEMSGDERARFCSLCSKHVYNLTDMSRAEAEALILEKEGKLCIRYAQRADGTIITDNCPVGLRSARDRMRWIGAGVAAALAFTTSCLAAALGDGSPPSFRSWFVEQQKEIQLIAGNCVFVPPKPVSNPTTTNPTNTTVGE